MGSLQQLLGTLSADPRTKGREFELLARWYLENEPEYASIVEQVWLWDEWPERWGADAGIDLVVKTRLDTLWAVQAKAYDSKYSVTKSDLDSFLSESSRADFDFRLLIATTDRIGGTASRTIAAQEKPVGSLMLADLEASVLEWPDSMDDLRPAAITRATPRPHQREAIDAAMTGLKEHDRGKVVMACGTGKTYVGLWLHEELDSDLTLVLVPSLSLLKQTLREWTTHRNAYFDYLAICSDETVDRDEKSDSFVSSTSALGYPVTTDVGDIGRFLRASGPRVVFSTYQSSPRLAEAMAATPGARFDLAIADEAHRCTGPATSAFSTVLDDTLIPARKRIFMTATPRYYTGRVIRKAGERDLDIASMDNDGVFGPDLYTLLFAEAIEKGLLSDYRVLVVGVNNAMYREYAERGELVRFDGDRVTDARTLAREIGLAKAMRDYDLKRVLTFHSRVKGAQDFSKELPEVINWMSGSDSPTDLVACDFVSGKMNAGDREVRLRRLRTLEQTDRVVLSNARCLAEGVDVPGIDGVAFIDPRRSQVDVVQAVGRALRLSDDKTAGTVVISVFVGDGEDAEEAVESSEFEPVWQVVKALRSHDPTIGEWLDQLRAINADGRTPITTADLPDRILVDFPVSVGTDFAGAFATRLVTQNTSQWEFWFGLLSNYVTREGTALVLHDHIEEGFNLGNWVMHQRTSYRKDKLPADHSARLEAMTGWTWEPAIARWEAGFAALKRYEQLNGHIRVQKGDVDREGVKLEVWMRSQRQSLIRGTLPPDLVARLEAIPGWAWNAVEHRWNEDCEALERYVALHGEIQVPRLYVDEDGHRVGQWVHNRRDDYRRGKLSQARIDRIERIPHWSWDPLDALWEATFNSLARFTELNGHSRVPRKYVDEDGVLLNHWVNRQRKNFRADKLPTDRAVRLEAIKGWSWHSLEDAWEAAFELLGQYVAREGHTRVPQRHSVGRPSRFKLGQWVLAQHVQYNLGTLSADRIQRLERVSGWEWKVGVGIGNPVKKVGIGNPVKKDEALFRSLESYAELNGHIRVPQAYVDQDGLRLGYWVNKQCRTYRAGKLSSDLVARLEAMPGWAWSWNALDVAWQATCTALERYVELNGHTRVPRKYVDEDGFNLGSKVNRLRQTYRAGKLSPARAARLEAMRGWAWNAFEDRWNESCAALERYAELNGHTRVLKRYVDEDGFNLGVWVDTLRQTYRAGKLSPARVARLEVIPGWAWNIQQV